MIKINLLPRTINEKKIIRNTAILFGVLIIAVVVAGVFYKMQVITPQVVKVEADAAQAEQLQTQVTGLEKERDDWKAKVPPIKSKLDFIKGVLEYNTKYPALYEQVAKWTYNKVSYVSMVSDGTQIAMQARVHNLDDLGRFLLNMYKATDLFTEVTISGVPGYPMGQSNNGGGGISAPMPMGPGMTPFGFGPQANLAGMGAINVSVEKSAQPKFLEFTVNCKLKTPIVAPTFTAAAAGAAPAGAAPAAGAGAPPAPAAPPAGGAPAP